MIPSDGSPAPVPCNTCRQVGNLAGYCTNKQCSRHGRTNDYMAKADPPLAAAPSLEVERAAKRLREVLDYLKSEHNAPCGEPECGSVYCFMVALAARLPALEEDSAKWREFTRPRTLDHIPSDWVLRSDGSIVPPPSSKRDDA